MGILNFREQKGITIVEILIVLPLASLIMVTLLSVLFNQYTDSILESTRSNLRSSGQALLINLQDELLFTIAYGEEIDDELTDPYAPSGGWTYNTNPNTLIINEVALDSTRRDDDRHIVRRQINNCESSSVTSNPVSINNVIYFIQDNPDSEYSNLYKRTLTPAYTTCSIDTSTGDPCTPISSTCRDNAKVTTCPKTEVGNNNCEDEDSLLSENVIDMQLTYFAKDNVVTPYPSAADKIEVTLTLGEKVYGREAVAVVNHTIRKIN